MYGEQILDISDPIAGFDKKNTTKYLSFKYFSRGDHLLEEFLRENDLTLWRLFSV